MSFLRHKSAPGCLRPARAAVGGCVHRVDPDGLGALAWSEMWNKGILGLRAARTLMASVAGAGLSVAGVVFQSLLRNPLAEPYVLGVTAGAGLGAALAIVTGITMFGLWTVPGMAFVGALGTILLVQALARTPSGAVPVETMLLAGITVSAVLNSLLDVRRFRGPFRKTAWRGVVAPGQPASRPSGGSWKSSPSSWPQGWRSPSSGPAT